jgi:hypothetical protein
MSTQPLMPKPGASAKRSAPATLSTGFGIIDPCARPSRYAEKRFLTPFLAQEVVGSSPLAPTGW